MLQILKDIKRYKMTNELYILLEGYKYLYIIPNNIETLSCWHNKLKSLKQRPSLCQFLSGKFKSCKKLPDSITSLNISNNKFTYIDKRELPCNLIILSCEYNLLNQLPILPNSLEELNCKYNILTKLATKLPNSLIQLNCSYNKLKYLPPLPPTLKKLDCSNNNLIELPPFPQTLIYLDCSNNNLIELPYNLSETSLYTIKCRHNNLNSLPPLPKQLSSLSIEDNVITQIPYLPNTLRSLCIGHNQVILLEKFNYPNLIKIWFNTPNYLQLISYINSCNREMIKAQMDKINKNNILWELYMQRMMHPSRFTPPLLNNDTLDIEEYIKAYIDTL